MSTNNTKKRKMNGLLTSRNKCLHSQSILLIIIIILIYHNHLKIISRWLMDNQIKHLSRKTKFLSRKARKIII